jgi:hypothetical protein
MALRIALYEAQPSPLVMSMSDEDVMRQLAHKLVTGALVLSVGRVGGWPSSASDSAGSAAASAAADTASAAAPVVNLNKLADPPPAVAVLPALEEAQIEGAEVLPEVDQSLAQIDTASAPIGKASVSLQPTPGKVPDISTATKDASKAIGDTLDAL